MPGLTIVYWRDIPAQVIVGKGRSAARAALPERFEQAVDRAAMKAGLRDGDGYLAEWRRAGPVEMAGEPDRIAAGAAARLDADYPPERLKTLGDNGGRE